ncbi:hypothetical protein [Vampirovibrio chlorellavorus]|uniref:DODA-type extradiol aromatic ring-opening family dioxygenase n=1 Tax=Vampirovibrio chlorellavorus TaxID=758823 RepID=UPI0026E9E24C|nr:hypothetical protein [Vampirovibrio chlorellavorus]
MNNVLQGLMVPGFPHLAFPDVCSGSWQSFVTAMNQAAQRVDAAEPDLLVLYSAQWISVLGHSFQYAAHPQGLHVDENWHELGALPFAFEVERPLTAQAEALARQAGLATRLVDYEGFPIDTGTIVALRYLNAQRQRSVVLVSANIYASPEDCMTLGAAMAQAVEESGKRAVFINCSLLSHQFLNEAVSPESDRFSSPEADQWNQRFLGLLQQGSTQEALALAPDYIANAQPEMNLKGFYWMMGALNMPNRPADVMAYGPFWGTGAVVLAY